MASDKSFPKYKGFVILKDNPYLSIAVENFKWQLGNISALSYPKIMANENIFSFGKSSKKNR